jgi:hypothetical protein
MALFLLVFCYLVPATHAQSGIPDLDNSWCELEPGSFVVVPGGTGPTLAEQGVVVQLWLRDNFDQPIPGFPRQDIWLDDPGNGDISLCQAGTFADANTDSEGFTTISGPVYGGGWTQSGMTVYGAGLAIAQTPHGTDYSLDLEVNSPDINGDRVVDIQDISLFAGDITGYAFRSDFNFDAATDLSDISLFSGWLGTSCP